MLFAEENEWPNHLNAKLIYCAPSTDCHGATYVACQMQRVNTILKIHYLVYLGIYHGFLLALCQ